MRVFISGASGLVGGNCHKWFKSKGWDVVGSHFSYPTDYTVPFNTLDPDNADNFNIEAWQPDYIIHCGALTWVDYCEDHEAESFEKTVKSTLNLVALAQKLNSKLVFISTDYVFDGESGPYDELHPTRPLSIYGKHKLEAEEAVLKAIPDSLVLRVTNVYGTEERNKNFVMRLVDNVRKGEKMTLKLPYDQYATPVNALDIAKALYLLISDSKSGVYNLASTDYLNRMQLAQKVLGYLPDHHVTLEPVSTEELNPPATRPLQGGLKTGKFLSEYPNFHFTNVDDFLKEITA
jgi:dTDP-4-dehydrorhamnose reductase